MAPRTAHGATAGVRQQLASETQFHRVQTRDANRCRGMTSVRSKRASRPDEELRGGGHCSLCTCTYTLSELLSPSLHVLLAWWLCLFFLAQKCPPDCHLAISTLTSILPVVSRPSGQRTFHPAHGATTSYEGTTTATAATTTTSFSSSSSSYYYRSPRPYLSNSVRVPDSTTRSGPERRYSRLKATVQCSIARLYCHWLRRRGRANSTDFLVPTAS